MSEDSSSGVMQFKVTNYGAQCHRYVFLPCVSTMCFYMIFTVILRISFLAPMHAKDEMHALQLSWPV